MAHLRKVATETDELQKIKPQLQQMEARLANNLDRDLDKSKEEIMFLVKEEFVARTLLEKGRIEATFEIDNDIQKALEVLADTVLYNQTLRAN